MSDLTENVSECITNSTPKFTLIDNNLATLQRLVHYQKVRETPEPEWWKPSVFYDESYKSLHKSIKVNGYEIESNYEIGCSYVLYKDLIDDWNDKTEMSYDEFKEKYDDVACSDWAKMDRHGKCFVGFYDYPEGSYERENAFTLTREDNCKALYELPYPRHLIFITINIGCNLRLECVKFTNFLCEWMKRRIKQNYMYELELVFDNFIQQQTKDCLSDIIADYSI
jgi:hypothetical protein